MPPAASPRDRGSRRAGGPTCAPGAARALDEAGRAGNPRQPAAFVRGPAAECAKQDGATRMATAGIGSSETKLTRETWQHFVRAIRKFLGREVRGKAMLQMG